MEERLAPAGHGKPKGGKKRKDTGPKIVVRLTAEENARLVANAKGRPVSVYVRQKLFGADDGRTEAGDRSRDVLRMVAVLHHLGRQLQHLKGKEGVDPSLIAFTLTQVLGAINGHVIASDIPELQDAME